MRTKNVVTIGGGTGSFTLLSGLKNYPISISAIVSMADDGGSTGVLRDELGVLPPGDVRQCLVALSDSSEMLRELMNYRFENGGLKGHSFGNLFLSALEKINKSFSLGVDEATKILNVKGRIIPVTNQNTNLFMLLNNGKVLRGQDEINHNFEIEKVGIKNNYLNPYARANPVAVQKILEADLVIIGPGNHYCSIVPNFLVKGIPEAMQKTKAKVVYNCNLVNKKGHTEHFSLDTYISAINALIGKDRIDCVTLNTRMPNARILSRYESQKELLVCLDEKFRTVRNFRIIRTDLLSKKSVVQNKADAVSDIRSFIRHDSEKLARVLVMIMELGEYENIIRDII